MLVFCTLHHILHDYSKGEESKTPAKPLSGSMKNTPASLSIIEAPTASVGKSTRSTRSSIDPSFAAKQRNFLNKVHNALSSTHYNDMDDTSGESDHEMVVEKEVSDDKSPEYVPGLEEIPKKLLNGIKRRREEALNKSKVSPGTAQEHTIITDPTNEVTSEPSPKKRASMTAPDGVSWFYMRPFKGNFIRTVLFMKRFYKLCRN